MEDVTYTAIDHRSDNIIVCGRYWGQRSRPLFWRSDIVPTWYVCFTPEAFRDDSTPYTEHTVGVSIADSDYERTIRQLIRLSQMEEVPF